MFEYCLPEPYFPAPALAPPIFGASCKHVFLEIFGKAESSDYLPQIFCLSLTLLLWRNESWAGCSVSPNRISSAALCQSESECSEQERECEQERETPPCRFSFPLPPFPPYPPLTHLAGFRGTIFPNQTWQIHW